MLKEKLAVLKNRAVAIPFATGLLVLSGSAAFATADPNAYDPTSLFTEVTTWITGVLIPATVALFVLGITIRLGFKMVRKFANRVG